MSQLLKGSEENWAITHSMVVYSGSNADYKSSEPLKTLVMLCYSRHVGTLGKSLTHSCLWRFSMKLRHTVSVLCRERFWVEVDLKRRYINGLNE